MARIIKKIDKTHQDELAKSLFEKFGKKLSHSLECETLSAEINIITGKYISANTVRRFLGFLDHNFSPSLKTLDILSEYAGFHDWHSFTTLKSTSSTLLTLDQEALLYLNFYSIDIKAEADMNYHNACRIMAIRILQNPTLLKQMASKLARINTSRIYFYERFPFIDGLCNNTYIDGLKAYLKRAGPESLVFGNALLFLSGVLSRSENKISAYYNIIENVKIDEHTHPFIVARKLGTILLYKHLNHLNTTEILNLIKKESSKFNTIKKIGHWHYPYFQHMICDYLNLAGFYKESIEVLKTIPVEKKYEVEKGYEEALTIINQISKASQNGEKYIQWLSDTEDFHNIHPMFKKYFRIQALHKATEILPKGKKLTKFKAELNNLIIETGFVYFSKVK